MPQKILIIEDSKSVAQLVSDQLTKAGYETHIALDAMLGISESIRWRPDLILLDLMLPAGGGVSVLKTVKNSTLTQKTPVLVLSSATDPEIRKQVLSFGVQTILQKPHDPETLLSSIREMIG